MAQRSTTVHVFESLEESDRAEAAYYRLLTPEQRVDLVLELVSRYTEAQGEAAKRFARVHRVVGLEAS